ncbi:DUF4199 domain-containing protein [Alistipes timonensis]|uniref:DUF4199 domain-containing protein n=1 Tax=Alistipes timonensis TaxID=1465754 RepID=UPI00266F1D2D|nr:DUF4199 domain-containing protein [Alistipes timonensis]
MEKNNFWNEAAKCGAVIGVILAVSNMLENSVFSTEGMGFIYLMVLEFFAVAALHYYLLHRYTRRRSQLYTADEGFTFGQGYGFLLAVSGFAGIIVGVVQAVYLHLIVGYSAYIDRYVAWMTGLFAQMGSASSSVEGILSQAITELQNTPAPSILKTLWGGVWSSLLFGAIFGLIIAGVIARAPKPFDTEVNE